MSSLERISYMDYRIRDSGGIRVVDVAQHFETSTRQIKRDIEHMRYRLNAPIEYVRERSRYEYTESFQLLADYNEKALLFYVFSRAAAGTLAYVPITEEAGLDSILKAIPRDLRPLTEKIRYKLPDFEPVDAEVLSTLITSLSESRRFDTEYKAQDGKITQRQAVCLRLLNYAGVWYSVAWDLGKADIRMFRLARIQKIALSRERVEDLPDESRIDHYLDGSYGVFKGATTEVAVIRFFGWARSVVESEIWHPEQARSEGSDPERGPWVQLEIPASHFEELLGRTLRFGSMALPISPASFINAWRTEIERMYKNSREYS